MAENINPLAALEAEIEAERKKLDEARAARAAASETPEAQALAARAKLSLLRAEREAEERAAEDDLAWLKAEAQHGAGVRRIHTSEGDIILKANTSQEWEAIQARAESVANAAFEKGDATRANADTLKAYREGIITRSRIHPSVERTRAILEKLPGVWPDLVQAREELNRGPRVAAGKGDAR